MATNKSKMRRKADGSLIRYRRYLKQSFLENSRDNIIKAKGMHDQYESLIMKHITDFSNVNQTIIGSEITSLLMLAKSNPDEYLKTRAQTLKGLFLWVDENNAWLDLWRTMVSIETNIVRQGEWITDLISSEMLDLFRINFPVDRMIFGVTKNGQAILRKPIFYVTNDLLNKIENPASVGRKKTRELDKIQYQTLEWMHYLAMAYGLYNEDNSDLLAQNGMDYDKLDAIELPRKITDGDRLISFIMEERKYTMNPNGVVIDCYNCGDIEQVTFVENEGYVLWKVLFKSSGITLNSKGKLVEDKRGAEYCGYFNEDFTPRSLFSAHSSFIEFEMDLYDFLYECYADIVCGTVELNRKFNREAVNVGSLQMMEDETSDKEANVVGFRYTPRKVYNRAKKVSTTKQQLNREIEKYFVSGHLRKLPDQYASSTEAIRNASEFGIVVPEGYTFVRPYTSGEEKVRTRYIKRI